ncbi:GNAT family N-acetyltransferase [Anaerosporobacter sp.]|uniref:GNAT family N-acetyltransferase n=1 Tax=Anaerosporobacter sp. TaxID=1872529 RepID=UPI00286F6DAC|nr:GNAT family N-acetyltransferase [Anaerosporobacter sp.]
MEIINLNDQQVEELEQGLEEYDKEYIHFKLDGGISIGICEGSRVIAGVDACMTAFHILYVSTVFVSKEYRRQGLGRKLMLELEERAKQLGADMIRLDTFDWQGKAFYESLGYENVGQYENSKEGFSEYFFLKRL